MAEVEGRNDGCRGRPDYQIGSIMFLNQVVTLQPADVRVALPVDGQVKPDGNVAGPRRWHSVKEVIFWLGLVL